MQRCAWPKTELDIAYHDSEWGVPVHDDRLLFEMLIFEGVQVGLSWSTILKKRENYRRAFDNFNARKIASYDSRKVKALLADLCRTAAAKHVIHHRARVAMRVSLFLRRQ